MGEDEYLKQSLSLLSVSFLSLIIILRLHPSFDLHLRSLKRRVGEEGIKQNHH